MDFLSTLKHAHHSIKALHKEIDRVERHAHRMSGSNNTIPFDHSDKSKQRRYSKYNAVAHQLCNEMRQLEHRLPEGGNYYNVLGWAMAFDEISQP